MLVMSLNCHREVSAKFKIPRRTCWERPRAAHTGMAAGGRGRQDLGGRESHGRDVLGGFESRQISPALGGGGEIPRNSRVGV